MEEGGPGHPNHCNTPDNLTVVKRKRGGGVACDRRVAHAAACLNAERVPKACGRGTCRCMPQCRASAEGVRKAWLATAAWHTPLLAERVPKACRMARDPTGGRGGEGAEMGGQAH